LNEAEALFHRPWRELQETAWEVRQHHHPAELVFAVPGVKRYQTEHYRNTPHRFASISLTGLRAGMRALPGPTPDRDAAGPHA